MCAREVGIYLETCFRKRVMTKCGNSKSSCKQFREKLSNLTDGERKHLVPRVFKYVLYGAFQRNK
jgi:hypothetical protein